MIEALAEKGIVHLERMAEADNAVTIYDLKGFLAAQVKGDTKTQRESITQAAEKAWRASDKGKRSLRFLSLFSGVEAASIAWKPLGWECVGLSEIEPYACAVLAERLPHVPNLGDICDISREKLNEIGPIDIVIGGSPCQSFSLTGLRKGLDDPRGLLMFQYIRVVNAARPRWFIWENVQGALSAEEGRAFGTLLGAMAECGYAMGWRVLDAKRFGIPHSRKRVFLIGTTTGAHKVYSVLFGENISRWNAAKDSRPEESAAAPDPSFRVKQGQRSAVCMVINGEGHPRLQGGDGDSACCLLATHGTQMRNWIIGLSQTETISREENLGLFSRVIELQRPTVVRRLSSVEMERLQGFPDDWTDIEWTGPALKRNLRRKCLGNSMAAPVIRWLGEGIGMAISL